MYVYISGYINIAQQRLSTCKVQLADSTLGFLYYV